MLAALHIVLGGRFEGSRLGAGAAAIASKPQASTAAATAISTEASAKATERCAVTVAAAAPPTADDRKSSSSDSDAATTTNGGGGGGGAGDHNGADTGAPQLHDGGMTASFAERGLRTLPAVALQRLAVPPQPPRYQRQPQRCQRQRLGAGITTLNLSCNELADVPGLSCLAPTLTALDLSRNWLRDLPREVAALHELVSLDASRNFLRPNPESLRAADLGALPRLAALDLRYNRKCDRQGVLDMLAKYLPKRMMQPPAAAAAAGAGAGAGAPAAPAGVRITIAFPAPDGAFVGANPCDRDPALLRSQLEPWSTLVLRRRLVDDFALPPSDPETVGRAEVMQSLLHCYEAEQSRQQQQQQGVEDAGREAPLEIAEGGRVLLRVKGTPVSEPLLAELRAELRAWSRRLTKNVQERPSIRARKYQILRTPQEDVPATAPAASAVEDSCGRGPSTEAAKKTKASKASRARSNKAKQAAAKLEANARLWELARRAILEVDKAFAASYTAVAVTYGFTGSPHIDKQNVGPFYGLALGDFEDGTGGVRVECNARVVCEVNTRNRLGKVDGRYPHWVAPYGRLSGGVAEADEEGGGSGCERFSLIYYQTDGEPTPREGAVFCPETLAAGDRINAAMRAQARRTAATLTGAG